MKVYAMRRSLLPVLLLLVLAPVPGCGFSGGARNPAATPAPTLAEALQIPSISTLAQYSNGPGVAVWAPDCAPSDRGFATGVAGWLQFTLGGHGELGKTPLWSSYARFLGSGLKVDPAAPNPATVQKIARGLGITHLVTAELTGDENQSRLVLRLCDASRVNMVGAPIELAGSRADLVRRLPDAARELCRRLGIAAPRVPDTVAVTAADLAVLGNSMRPDGANGHPDQIAHLETLAQRSPYAEALSLLNSARNAAPDQAQRAMRLIGRAPDHVLAWGIVTEALLSTPSMDAIPLRERFNPVLQRFPHSYVLRETDGFLWSLAGMTADTVAAQEEAVRCSSNNPKAWHNLGDAISSQANAMRQGRFAGDISPAEWEILTPLYSRWAEADRRATQLDPDSAEAWLALSGAAAFNGDAKLASQAFERAFQLEPHANVYAWGLNLYSPKWFNDPVKLKALAEQAARDPHLSSLDRSTVAMTLHGLGHDPWARGLLPAATADAVGKQWSLERQAIERQGLERAQREAAANGEEPAAATGTGQESSPPPAISGAETLPNQQDTAGAGTDTDAPSSGTTAGLPPRHQGGLFALAWCPRGNILASTGHDGVKLWYPDTGKQISLPGIVRSQYALAWSQDSSRLACAGADGAIHIWTVQPLKEAQTPLRAGPGPVRALAWSSNGKQLAAGGDDAFIRLWDVASAKQTRILRGHRGPVSYISYSPDGKCLLSAAYQPGAGKVRKWDLGAGGGALQFDTPLSIVPTVSWNPNGKAVAVGTPRAVTICDARDGQKQATWADDQYSTLSVVWSPDGKFVLSSRGDRKLHLFDAGTGTERGAAALGDSHAIALAWRPNSGQIAAGAYDGTISLHSVDEFNAASPVSRGGGAGRSR